MSVEDLRLGLGLELAQLLPQPRHRLTELAEMEIDRMELLVQPRLEDVDLAGAVQQRVEERRVDAGRLRPLRGASVGLRGPRRDVTRWRSRRFRGLRRCDAVTV